MSEINIAVEDFYRLTKGSDGLCCRVKGCKTERAKDRSLCGKHRIRLWRKRNPTRNAFNQVRSKARQRKIEFDLSFDDFKVLCEESGYVEGKGRRSECLSLDRQDPDKGYTVENIEVITYGENCSKGAYERWVDLPSGKRVRFYQIAAMTDAQAKIHIEESEEEEPDWGLPPIKEEEECIDEQEIEDTNFIPTEDEPF